MAVTPTPLPIASYALPDLRAGAKRLVNCFPTMPSAATAPEPDDTKDQQQLIALRRWAGTTTFASFVGATGAVRGIWEMAGTIYVVIGSIFAQLTAGGVFTQLNPTTPIPGSGFVRMTDNTACLVILVPGTDQCFTYTPFTGGGGFQQLTSSFFLTLGGAIDCWFVDTYIVFLANNNNGAGSYTFFNDDGKQVSGNAQITFTTAASFSRQFGTDPFYGLCVDHREVLAFGSRTTEGYVNTGNAVGSPFSTAPDTYMPYGMHPQASFTIALQDNGVFWVANDLTVRRREGQTPVRVSDEGIEAILQTAAAGSLLAGSYGMALTFAGAPLYILTIPKMQRTLAYNCVTQKWFELSSFVNGVQQQWRALVAYNGFGLQLVGDAQGPNVGYLDQTTSTEFGTSPVICLFMTQPLYDRNKLLTVWRVEAAVTAGQAAVGANAPSIQLLLSDNWGNTFYAFDDESQTLGVPGDTDNRAVWWTLGQHRSLVAQFRVSDPSPLFAVSITADVDEAMDGY